MSENPIGLDGIEFVEFASPQPALMEKLFEIFGFVKIGTHKTKKVNLYRQGNVNFILNQEENCFAHDFWKKHGPSVCAMGFRTTLNDNKALQAAVERGGRKYDGELGDAGYFPAMYGIGDSLIYFIDRYGENTIYNDDFDYISENLDNEGVGFDVVDHLTNNVPVGKMQEWCDFYEKIFNFKEVRFFDIKGEQTGLVSKVMKSPCGKIIIPINEPTDEKSQIQEYIEEYKGEGVQHLAMLTNDICHTISKLREAGVQFLDVPDTYYEMLPDRLDNIEEDLNTLKNLRILADGDNEGYLLQLFTQNIIGPIFFEVIQRKNHDGFGEGNFQALFDAIERDQRRRGVL